MLGFVCRISKNFCDPLCLKSLYCSLVRSVLETSAIVWSPYHDSWIQRIEAVQRRFLRFALRLLPWCFPQHTTSYEERCALLGLEPLHKRRKVSGAVFVAKLLKGEIDSAAILADLNLFAPDRILRPRNTLRLQFRNTDYGCHEPIRSMSINFNLCSNVFDFNISTASIRRNLRRYQFNF